MEIVKTYIVLYKANKQSCILQAAKLYLTKKGYYVIDLNTSFHKIEEPEALELIEKFNEEKD